MTAAESVSQEEDEEEEEQDDEEEEEEELAAQLAVASGSRAASHRAAIVSISAPLPAEEGGLTVRDLGVFLGNPGQALTISVP